MIIKTNLVVSAPEPVVTNSSGREEVFKTSISHPLLEGELYFYHGSKDRDVKLTSLQNTILDDINQIIAGIESLRDIKKPGKVGSKC